MNLLFAFNQKFIPLFLTCMKSIVRHGGESHYDAYILHSDLDGDQKAIRRSVGPEVTCHFIDLEPALFEGFPETKRYPKQIYYRLAAPLLLPEHLERVLYQDVDTVVINPLKSLYEMDFEENYYIACSHTNKVLTKVNQARLGADKNASYINSGVMMLNLPLLRENLRLTDIRDYANERMRAFILPDQDILTALYGHKVKLADTILYNLSDRILTFYNADPTHEPKDLRWVRQNSVVIHYCGKNKPWNDTYFGILDIFYKELIR